MSHSAEKCERGDPFGFINIHSVAKFKNSKEDPLGTLKNFRKKVAQCRKQNRKGDSLAPFGFVGYLEKVKKLKGHPLD